MLVVLVVVVSTVGPPLPVNQRVTRHSQIGPALLALGETEVTHAEAFGSFAVQRQHFYQVELEETNAKLVLLRPDPLAGKDRANTPGFVDGFLVHLR